MTDGLRTTRDYERACDHSHGYEFDAEVCPICGWAEPEPGTVHDGWCEGHSDDAVVLEPVDRQKEVQL